LEGRSVTLIVIDVSYPWITNLGWDSNTFKKGNIILKGPPGRLSGAEIAKMLDNLVLNKEGNGFVGYGNDHN
jgi:hypothetical protein